MQPSRRPKDGNVFHQNEVEQSTYNFEHSDVEFLLTAFNAYEKQAKNLMQNQLALPAYEQVLKAGHSFNLLDARGAISQDRFDWPVFQSVQSRLAELIEDQGERTIHLDFSGLKRAYPNGFVPLVVLVECYWRQSGVDYSLTPPADAVCARYVADSNYFAYLGAGAEPKLSGKPNALHRFSDDISLNQLIDSQIHQVLEQATYAQGVLQSFEWMLNEVAGNVLVLAGTDHGWNLFDGWLGMHAQPLTGCTRPLI